jgi:hypothetical protein
MENKRDEMQGGDNRNALILTEEEINTQECYRNLSPEQKAELIALVYELSLALYHLYSKGHE